MWIEVDGKDELEHEGIKCAIALVNLDTGVQVVKRIREHSMDIENEETKNRYQLIIRNLGGNYRILKEAESDPEINRELNRVKEIIREREGDLPILE